MRRLVPLLALLLAAPVAYTQAAPAQGPCLAMDELNLYDPDRPGELFTTPPYVALAASGNLRRVARRSRPLRRELALSDEQSACLEGLTGARMTAVRAGSTYRFKLQTTAGTLLIFHVADLVVGEAIVPIQVERPPRTIPAPPRPKKRTKIVSKAPPSAASAQGKETPTLDIAILIDTSGSTAQSTGVDVNGNGVVGLSSGPPPVIRIFGRKIKVTTDPGDSVLAAEVLAAKKLIAQLDPQTTRVAIVSFSGDYLPETGPTGDRTYMPNPDTPDAFLKQPLTSNFQLAPDVLDQIERDGPYGGTNISEGIQVAIKELTGLSGSGSVPRRDAQKVILLLTDGLPTFPVGSHRVDPGDITLTVEAGKMAGRHGIKIYTFALGREALSEPFTVKEVARVTGGRFTPVPDPGDIITVLPGINLSSE